MSNSKHALTAIYSAFAVTRAGSIVHLAVHAGSGQLEHVQDWLSEMAPSAVCGDMGGAHEAMGSDAMQASAGYDQILRIIFPSAVQATVFVAACRADAVAQRAQDDRRLGSVGQAVRRAAKDDESMP